jgi:hypothetical protein
MVAGLSPKMPRVCREFAGLVTPVTVHERKKGPSGHPFRAADCSAFMLVAGARFESVQNVVTRIVVLGRGLVASGAA